VTSDAIRERNRANAMKSTGPRTAAGKAIVAGNARRHGATSRPDPSAVDTWLGIILDKPDISPAELLPGDERGFRALVLAEAEARLARCEQALIDFEGEPLTVDAHFQERLKTAEEFRQYMKSLDMTSMERKFAQFALRNVELNIAAEISAHQGHHRLLGRYLSEARAARRRAFAAWHASMIENEERQVA
jgi:hypothetical protein